MMDNSTGAITMLKPEDFRIQEPPPGHTILFGREDEIRRIGRAVELGERELARRAARRKQQKASRRRNR